MSGYCQDCGNVQCVCAEVERERSQGDSELAASVGSASRKELILRGIVGTVSLMDLDGHLLNVRRSLNSMAGHMRKSSREQWSPAGAQQILAGVAKAFKQQAKYVQECRAMLKTVQEIITPKRDDVSPNGDVSGGTNYPKA